ncbi:MAG: hypothetical protein ABIR78_11570 [Ferruginibacter sp.]
MKKILVAVFAFSALYMSSCKTTDGGDPKSVLISFFDAMAKKDIATARKLATADSKSMFDLMEMGMKMADTAVDDQVKEKFDRSKMEFGEPKIDGDRATVNVKENKSGESMNFILKKESGSWKVALDMNTMMTMGTEKMKEKGMSDEEAGKMQEEMDRFKNMSADSIKMMMEKAKQAMDSLKLQHDPK